MKEELLNILNTHYKNMYGEKYILFGHVKCKKVVITYC